jgi:hypothetical protein
LPSFLNSCRKRAALLPASCRVFTCSRRALETPQSKQQREAETGQ